MSRFTRVGAQVQVVAEGEVAAQLLEGSRQAELYSITTMFGSSILVFFASTLGPFSPANSDDARIVTPYPVPALSLTVGNGRRKSARFARMAPTVWEGAR